MNKFSAPIWVAHPEKPGLQVDVAPFLNALGDFDAPVNSPINKGATEVIRRTLRTLNLSEHKLVPQGNLIDLYQDLHRLEDMFAAVRQQRTTEA